MRETFKGLEQIVQMGISKCELSGWSLRVIRVFSTSVNIIILVFRCNISLNLLHYLHMKETTAVIPTQPLTSLTSAGQTLNCQGRIPT